MGEFSCRKEKEDRKSGPYHRWDLKGIRSQREFFRTLGFIIKKLRGVFGVEQEFIKKYLSGGDFEPRWVLSEQYKF